MQKSLMRNWNSLLKASAMLSVLVLFSLLASLFPMRGVQAQEAKRVIHISVDALGSKYLEQFLKEFPDDFSNFARLINEGASTLNARTDYSTSPK